MIPMPRINGSVLLFIFPWLIFSQPKTPFTTYDHKSDYIYLKELKEIINSDKNKITIVPNDISCDDIDLIDPRKWVL